MSSHQLHHQQIPLGICPNRIRQLRRHCDVSSLFLSYFTATMHVHVQHELTSTYMLDWLIVSEL